MFIVWALLSSILAVFLVGPPGPAHFAAVAVSAVVAICYFYYLHRAGFDLRGKRFSGNQFAYYGLLIAIGVGLLVWLLK